MSPGSRIYLDHASSSPLRPAVAEAMAPWLSAADPGRLHEEGRTARSRLEEAREKVASLLGAKPREVVFTSGASESINSAVYGAFASRGGSHAVVAKVESAAVREASARWAAGLRWVDVDGTGRVDLDHFAAQVAHGDVTLAHCQLANQEVGTFQPLAEVVAVCEKAGVLLHVDATAALGAVDIDFSAAGCDLMSVSCHQAGGPHDIGALLVKRGLRVTPMIVGGLQERARRAGLENVAAAAGFAALADILSDAETFRKEAAAAYHQTSVIRDFVERLGGVSVYGPAEPAGRLAGLVCLGFRDLEAEPVLVGLDQHGVAAHSGSSCSSELLEPSPVLAAMGADSDRSLRLSVGWNTTDSEVFSACERLATVVSELRRLRASVPGAEPSRRTAPGAGST
ncbi:MAG: cysteine desulfurase family protein [Acidimicrobiales bacterium]